MKKHGWRRVGMAAVAVLMMVTLGVAARVMAAPDGLEDLPAWGVVPSPNTGFHPQNYLTDVEIISPTDVWAAGHWGNFTSPFDVRPQIQHFDGTQWTMADLPDGLDSGEMYGLDASAGNNVWAVGHYNYHVILQYNGTEWIRHTIPNPNNYRWIDPEDVAVLAPDDVWVVGEITPQDYNYRSMLFHWDGTGWTETILPNGGVAQLRAIEAISPTNIWAVGKGHTANLTGDVFHYDGTAWSRINDPLIDAAYSIDELTTLPTGEVWVAGTNEQSDFVAQWNGTNFTALPVPADQYTSHGPDIEAISPTNIWAVGLFASENANGPITWNWDGTAWTAVTVATNTDFNLLEGLDAQGEDDVWVVGRADGTLAAEYDGTQFTRVATENGGTAENILQDVDGVGPNDIWAVGTADDTAVITRWDGTSWELAEVPTDTANLELEGVDMQTTNYGWAVGFQDNPSSGNSSTKILRWDGTAWTRVPSPNPGAGGVDKLFAVGIVSETDAWAVGSRGDGNQSTTLRWNGTDWQNVPNSCSGDLQDIKVFAPDNIWAIGFAPCRWDGTSWTSIPAPNNSVYYNGIDGVSDSDLWVVGNAVGCDPFTCYSGGYAAHWNGSSWDFEEDALGSGLEEVEVLASDNVYFAGTSNVGTKLLHWDGGRLIAVPVPDPVNGGALNALYAADPQNMWAVGSYFNETYQRRTLILNAPSATQGAAFGETTYADATVLWLGPTTASTTTNMFGEYMLAGLLAGQYTVVATGDNCPPQSTQVYLNPGQIIELNFDLCGPLPTPLPTITATAQGPTSTPGPNEPTATPTPAGATATPNPEEPTSTPTPAGPTATSGPNEPTPTPSGPTATATQGPNEPTATPTQAPNEPTPSPFPGTLTPTAEPSATATTTPPELPVVMAPAALETTQQAGATRAYNVQMTNLAGTTLVWSSYTAPQSCYQPGPISWVTVAPDAGTTPAGGEHQFTVTVNTDGMAAGDYAGYVCVLDTTGRIKSLPVTVDVMAGGRLYLPMIQR